MVAPATLITALLIFFGWSRTTVLCCWFGIDPTSLGFSSTDYLLTSQDGLFVTGAVIALLVLVHPMRSQDGPLAGLGDRKVRAAVIDVSQRLLAG